MNAQDIQILCRYNSRANSRIWDAASRVTEKQNLFLRG